MELLRRDHDTESDDCWCKPARLHVCDACEEEEKPRPDCWKCAGRGLTPCPEPMICSDVHVIVHRCERCQRQISKDKLIEAPCTCYDEDDAG